MVCGRAIATFGNTFGLFERLREPLLQSFSDVPEVERLFRAIVAEQSAPAPGSRRMTRLYMEQCMIHLFRHLCLDGNCVLPWLTAIEEPALARVVDLILESPGANHTLESLAHTAAMSRSTFSQRFSEAFATTPAEFVRRVRLRRAAGLLRSTDLPIKAVAARVGFSSRSHFSRAFKAQQGVDPASYRQSLG